MFTRIQTSIPIKFHLHINKIRLLWIHRYHFRSRHLIIFKQDKLHWRASSVFVYLCPSPLCIGGQIQLLALEEYPIRNRTFRIFLQGRIQTGISWHECETLAITTGCKPVGTSFVLLLPGMVIGVVNWGSIRTELTCLPEV